MTESKHQVVWFDIPVFDLDRAIGFYSAVLGQQVAKQEYPGGALGILSHDNESIGGCLFVAEDEQPSDHGLLVYLNASGRLDEAIAAVEAHGGTVLKPKHSIGPHGFRAVVLDTEGNRVAL